MLGEVCERLSAAFRRKRDFSETDLLKVKQSLENGLLYFLYKTDYSLLILQIVDLVWRSIKSSCLMPELNCKRNRVN